jgi:hypothetical protein
VVLARYARNRRLGDALQQWAFCSLRGSPGARAYYQQLRDCPRTASRRAPEQRRVGGGRDGLTPCGRLQTLDRFIEIR